MPRASRVVREFSAPTMAAALVLAAALVSVPAAGAEFSAGGYSFSDELGGFRLLSASGTGTSDDPIVVREEILTTSRPSRSSSAIATSSACAAKPDRRSSRS